jgi:transposase
MRPHGSPEELERRRRRAVEMLQQGTTVTEVARRIGCSHSSVILWRATLRRRGVEGLQAKPACGRPLRLSARQLAKLPKLLLKGALAWDYTTDLWTTTRIAAVIQRELVVKFHRAHVGRLLARLHWSCQKPERRALERDEPAIDAWKRHRWRAIKKSPRSKGTLGFPGRKRLFANPQRPAHLGAPGPDAHRPPPLPAGQDFSHLCSFSEPTTAASGTLSSLVS